MKESAEIFDHVVRERRSVRIYDETAAFDEGAVERSLQRAILAPNSSNLQLWEFYRVKDPDKKARLAEMCLGQKAAVTANELIVIVTRRDKWKEHSNFILDKARESFNGKDAKKEKMVESYYKRIIPTLYKNDRLGLTSLVKRIVVNLQGMFKPMPREVTRDDVRVIVHKSAALAAQTFMLSMKAEGYDSCPMEGFDSVRVKKFLGLPSGAEVNMIVSVGTAKPEGIYGPRVRMADEKVIFNI
jgi:nitroreductase